MSPRSASSKSGKPSPKSFLANPMQVVGGSVLVICNAAKRKSKKKLPVKKIDLLPGQCVEIRTIPGGGPGPGGSSKSPIE